MSTELADSIASLNHLVFYDGLCGLCNRFVDFLLRIDKKHILRFAPLQGKTAGNFDLNQDLSDLKTVVFYSDGKLYTRSDAVIAILMSLGGLWKIAVICKLVPKGIRDYLYSFVAKNRIRWFGQKESCRLPVGNEKDRLLD